MRYPRSHKAETRKKILGVAARLFRERGYDGVGVDAIMGEAGLTAGGFYSHFSSKEALFAEAMAAALDGGKALGAASRQAVAASDPLETLIKSYLSRKHRDMVADGCPLPSLTSDVTRGSRATRTRYERQFLNYLKGIESLMPQSPERARDRTLALIAQCVGGLMIARAVVDEDLSNQILKACRQAARKISEG
jgi:TetR/AcrR family transcriptional regulator, transcriptional repressor for nem operon